MNIIREEETMGIRMSPLYEVSFTKLGADGEPTKTVNELLPASGFEEARSKAVRIANERGLITMGVIRSPWRVITEFVEFP